jgi:hypothetical protein
MAIESIIHPPEPAPMQNVARLFHFVAANVSSLKLPVNGFEPAYVGCHNSSTPHLFYFSSV